MAATLHGLVAQRAPTVVVLRRGPTRHTRLVRWNLRDDSLDLGQWLVGELERGACGLSPNGELLVYTARKATRRFTAVSRPPSFTALAFWEERLPWTGGGFFVRDDLLVLGVTHPPDQGSLPRGLTVSDMWSHFAWSGNRRSADTFGEAVLKAPEAHQGWSRNNRRAEKRSPQNPRLTLERDGALGRPGGYWLVESTGTRAATARDLGTLDWGDFGPDGSLLFGRQGLLYRQRLPDPLTETLPPASLVADLTGQAFEAMEPPEDARRWPLGLSKVRGR